MHTEWWSQFHQSNGVYAQGVSVSTAVLPDGWRDRLVPWHHFSTGDSLAIFFEPHDCVVSKLVAQRAKDFAFGAALLEAGLLDAPAAGPRRAAARRRRPGLA